VVFEKIETNQIKPNGINVHINNNIGRENAKKSEKEYQAKQKRTSRERVEI
jgi:hypothetical protein